MGLFRVFKSRYPLNPTHFSCTSYISPLNPNSNPGYFAISSPGYPSFSRFISSIASKFDLSSISPSGYCSLVTHRRSFSMSSVYFLSNQRKFVSLSSSVNTCRTKEGEDGDSMSLVDVSRIIDMIKSDESDLETRLNGVCAKISKWSVIEILHALNVTKVPAMRFFEWIRDAHPNLSRNADICSLMIDNSGQLGDYATMLSLLKDYRPREVCLNYQAFGFLPILSLEKKTVKKSIQGVITVLDEVGGSCRNSGIHSLLELLCSMNLFELANFVMEITKRRVSFYNILVKQICLRGDFEDARRVLEEMRELKCYPEATTYNFFISSLCKQGRIDEAFSVLEDMLKRGCDPNEITFEILIYFACRHRRSDQAVMFYNHMVSRGTRPRLPTHYAFIRGYFISQQFNEAYRYVVDTSVAHSWSAEGMYNVLACLHLKHGDILVAHNLVIEMIQKGIKPKYSLYVRVCKCLFKTGKGGFATNLKTMFSDFMLKLRENYR